MKNCFQKTLVLVSLVTIQLPMHAYKYSFFNHTDKPIAVAIQFLGEKEPLYKKTIRPQSKETFEEGKFDIPMIKANFCLKHIYYVVDPTADQKKNNFENAPWKERSIAWLPLKTYNETMELATKSKSKKQTPDQSNDASVKNLIKSNKQKQSKTLCTDQHFDIIEKDNVKPFFITPLKE